MGSKLINHWILCPHHFWANQQCEVRHVLPTHTTAIYGYCLLEGNQLYIYVYIYTVLNHYCIFNGKITIISFSQNVGDNCTCNPPNPHVFI